MTVDIKPLFRPEALRPHLGAFELPRSAPAGHAALVRWAKLLGSKSGQ